MMSWTRALVLCCFAYFAASYPSGAPVTTCGDLVPRHGDLKPQISESPYTLSTNIRRVTEGGSIRLILNSPDGQPFKGFMVQARPTNGAPEPLGAFTSVPEFAKALTCGSGIKNTLTHKDASEKNSLEFDWEPPSGYDGEVVFNTTFVKNGAVFWVGVESEPVQIVKRSTGDQQKPAIGISTTKIPLRVTTVPNYTPRRDSKAEAQTDPIYTGCEEDQKLCFGYPDGCFADKSCDAVVAIQSTPPDTFTFELGGSMEGNIGYIAVALSEDGKMGAEHVTECTTEPDTLYLSYNIPVNPDYGNNRLPTPPWLKLVDKKIADGRLYCKFTRPATSSISGVEYDLESSKYFILLAKGPLKGSGGVSYHASRAPSGSAQRLTDVGIVGAKSNILYRLHGAFMVAAWIGFAGTGMLVARYFKKTWVGKQVCGKDIWFAWHRGFMVITWTLTCAGFIIIFVEIGDWYKETSNPHAILGCITTGLAFIQPFAAALRPGPGSPKRPLFNWSHWFVGNLAHLLAVITIFFAIELAKAELPRWNYGLIGAYVAFHVVMHIFFSITDCCSERLSSKRVTNNFAMGDLGTNARNHPSGKGDSPNSVLRKFLLAIYLILIIAFTVALIVIVALAPIEENETFKTMVQFVAPSN